MPTSATARKAAETRRRLNGRIGELRRQGLSPDEARDHARFEFGLKGGVKHPGTPVVRPSRSGPAPTPTRQNPMPGGIRAQATASPVPSSPSQPSPAPSQPTPSQPASSAQSSIGQRLRQTATPVPADPNDPLTQQLKSSVLAIKPTWEVKDKTFRCWRPGGLKPVELPIEPKPGPFTPTEQIHDVLGQPDMLFAVCVAIAEGEHSLLEGPTGTAKTTVYRWLAKQLNWNVITMPISRGTEAAHMVGEYLPHESKNGSVRFEWTWGPVSTAVLASQKHPTLLVFEEINRIGNIQELARIYSLLDDTRILEVKEKRGAKGVSEMLRPGKLYVGATMNPADSEAADYIGVQELDPALRRRFAKQPRIGYPPEEIEAEALRRRVKTLKPEEALRMVKVATAVRKAETIRFPLSFPDMVSWATALPYYGWEAAAEVAVVSKAHPDYRASIRDLVKLQPTAAGAAA